MDKKDELPNMLEDIKKVVCKHINDDTIYVLVNLKKDDKTLSISISGITDMEIHFENRIEDDHL